MICKNCGHDIDKSKYRYLLPLTSLSNEQLNQFLDEFMANPIAYCPCGEKIEIKYDL